MAIFHFHIGVIRRRSGRTSVASASYRSGERLENEYDSKIHDFTYKKGVVYNEIMLPTNVPEYFRDRATLWNTVELSEKRCDAQTARDIDIALPIELNAVEQIAVMREYIQDNFVALGMIADFAIHDNEDGNPHAHIMLTMRSINNNGFGLKNRDWNNVEYLKKWRENWADICNQKLEEKRLDELIDHRTLKEQGIDREPTKHIGVAVKAMEQKRIDVIDRISDINRAEDITLENTNEQNELITWVAKLVKKEKDVMRLYLKQKISFDEYEQIRNILRAERILYTQKLTGSDIITNEPNKLIKVKKFSLVG